MFFFIQRSIDDLLFPFYKDQLLESWQVKSWYGTKLGWLCELDNKTYTKKDAERICSLMNRIHSATRSYKIEQTY